MMPAQYIFFMVLAIPLLVTLTVLLVLTGEN